MKTQSKLRVYTLNGLPPEVIAVAFAKCSRSPEPFDEIAAELDADKSRKFHERWVVGYGHGSVAEHAVLSLAIENVSILATKVIEDNRLASYTEKSTRYQVYDRNKYYKPKILMESELGSLYEETCDYILDSYNLLYEKMLDFVKRKYPKDSATADSLYEVKMKNKALDHIRYMLPVSCLTNLGMTVNARNLEHAITKLMSHPLFEMQEIGFELKKAAMDVTPTLVKYTEPNNYMIETEKAMSKLVETIFTEESSENTDGAVLVEYDKDAENKLIAALLYRSSSLPYKQIKDKVMRMSVKEKEKVFDEAMSRLGKHDRPLRELETVQYTFDVLMDYGAFRDLQRHRICMQTNQDFSIKHGYCIPDEVVEAGIDKDYRECMEKAAFAYEKIYSQFPKEAQYVIPLAYKKRTLYVMNLREACHMIKLRTGQQGHASYRKVCQQMYLAIKEKQPLMAKYIMCNLD